MFKLLIITLIVVYLMRSCWRLMYPSLPPGLEPGKPREIPLKACEYCGILVAENKGIHRRGHFFCQADHADRYYA